jgi:hypothetical protein
MGRVISGAAVIIAAAALHGCAGVTMIPASSQRIALPPPDRAQVVFMRTSAVSALIRANLFEVVDGELRFIGVLNTGKKVVYQLTPGHKVFMACGQAADFMLGDLAAGRTYYVIVRPNWGSGGMIPTPIRGDDTGDFNMSGPDFRQWLGGTTLVEPDVTEAQAWFSEQRQRYQQVYRKYWAKFRTKTSDEIFERTLRPEDGIASEQVLPGAYAPVPARRYGEE